MPHDIFISYSSADEQTAYAILDALEHEGLSCWISCRDIQAGMSWRAAIATALKNASVMVLVLSKTAIASQEVGDEVAIACAGRPRIPIIPFQLDDVALEGEFEVLRSIQALDARRGKRATHIDALTSAVRSKLEWSRNTLRVQLNAASHFEGIVVRRRDRRFVAALTVALLAIVGTGAALTVRMHKEPRVFDSSDPSKCKQHRNRKVCFQISEKNDVVLYTGDFNASTSHIIARWESGGRTTPAVRLNFVSSSLNEEGLTLVIVWTEHLVQDRCAVVDHDGDMQCAAESDSPRINISRETDDHEQRAFDAGSVLAAGGGPVASR